MADVCFVQDILNNWAAERQVTIQAEVFTSSESFLFRYAEDKIFDILLMDIEMGAMDGVTMAKQVRLDNEAVQIIFITGYPDYIAEGYEVAAINYLMKPVNKDKLFSALDRAVVNIRKSSRVILLPLDGEVLRLPIDNIQYVETFSHSVAIVTNIEIYEIKKSLTEMIKLLGNDVIRCHRSYLVGLRFISRISKTEVILDDGKVLPLSRSAAPVVHRAFISYYTGDNHENI
ncbi:MAG TPA: LytTR family DNA-binding domain-containing protein [Mobilitalea sp.]|nr:LytTR family DNA-binding domain-containing protein [Mobilitalea sp.]